MIIHTQAPESKSDIALLNNAIIDAIQDIKGKKIVKMDLRKTDGASTDYFIICEGDSITQVKAIASNVEKKVYNLLGVRPNHTEGTSNAKWVLVDYFNTVVHIFYPEARKFYALEDLWSDSDTEEFAEL